VPELPESSKVTSAVGIAGWMCCQICTLVWLKRYEARDGEAASGLVSTARVGEARKGRRELTSTSASPISMSFPKLCFSTHQLILIS
jgi:hypothetical protein